MNIVFIQEIVPSYRVPFFNKLAGKKNIDLTVISTLNGDKEGFGLGNINKVYFKWKILQHKSIPFFSKKILWFSGLLKTINDIKPEFIITTGNKKVLQNHLLLFLKFFYDFKLYFFQHAISYKKHNAFYRIFEKAYLKNYICLLSNGLILYTEFEKEYLIKIGFNEEKLFFVNNTLNTKGNTDLYNSISDGEVKATLDKYAIRSRPSILFIGRLVEGKSTEVVFDYFNQLKNNIPELQLVIIGSGPLLLKFTKQYSELPSVIFVGKLYDEKIIACIMKVVKFVFLPGYSGLTINHAFSYGKPFVTFESKEHKPEISYLENNNNGFILDKKEFANNIKILQRLLQDEEFYNRMSQNAKMTAQKYTMTKMVENFLIPLQSI